MRHNWKWPRRQAIDEIQYFSIQFYCALLFIYCYHHSVVCVCVWWTRNQTTKPMNHLKHNSSTDRWPFAEKCANWNSKSEKHRRNGVADWRRIECSSSSTGGSLKTKRSKLWNFVLQNLSKISKIPLRPADHTVQQLHACQYSTRTVQATTSHHDSEAAKIQNWLLRIHEILPESHTTLSLVLNVRILKCFFAPDQYIYIYRLTRWRIYSIAALI